MVDFTAVLDELTNINPQLTAMANVVSYTIIVSSNISAYTINMPDTYTYIHIMDIANGWLYIDTRFVE